MVIRSERFKGYLIAALGKNRTVDEALTKQVRTHLIDFLRAKGETLDDLNTESMEVDIKPVQFQDWAREQADFLLNSLHDANEVALAFFPTADVDVNLEKSVADNMLQLKIDDITEDTKLDFDVFIYLPANGRYILYNKEGGKMFSEQKGRLKERGITHIHLKKDSQLSVKRYKARNYLNSKIKEFETRKKNG